MSNDTTYRFRFFRSPEVWIDSWVEHETVGRIHYRLGCENGMGMLAHLMMIAGHSDGNVIATEINRKVPLVQHLESLHRLAEHRQPFPVPPAPVLPALRLLAKNPRSWLSISCKNDLLARDLVSVENGQASLTDAGTAMLDTLIAPKKSHSVVLTTNQREAFDIILNAPRKWSGVHLKTRNFMITAAWVEIRDGSPTLTDLGQGIYDRENAPQEASDKPSGAQCRAFEIAARQPYKWDSVPEKIAQPMIDSGWIIVRDDLPRLTDDGRRVYDACLADANAETRKAA